MARYLKNIYIHIYIFPYICYILYIIYIIYIYIYISFFYDQQDLDSEHFVVLIFIKYLVLKFWLR